MADRRRMMAKSGSHVDENGMITDSWDTFIANIKAGKGPSLYQVGNYIPLDLGTHGLLNMVIILFNPTWPRKDLAGYPNVALFSKECVNDTYSLNDFSYRYNGDLHSSTQNIYKNIVPNYLPATLKESIIPVYRPFGIMGLTLYSGMYKSDNTLLDNAFMTWTLTEGFDIANADYYVGNLSVTPLLDVTSKPKVKANGTSVKYWALLSDTQNSDGDYEIQVVTQYGTSGYSGIGLNRSGDISSQVGIPLGFCL